MNTEHTLAPPPALKDSLAHTESYSDERRAAEVERTAPAVAAPPAAAVPQGKIGPNALIQTVRVMRRMLGEEETAEILGACTLTHLLQREPETMVDEADFFDLADTLAAHVGDETTQTILTESGRLTAAYLLEHRIPKPFQRLLLLLPRRAAMKLLMTAIRKHAWTFVGSGTFTYELGRRPRLTIACSRDVTRAVCGFYGGTFEHLFQTLVDSNAHLEMITMPPVVRTYCVYWVSYSPEGAPA